MGWCNLDRRCFSREWYKLYPIKFVRESLGSAASSSQIDLKPHGADVLNIGINFPFFFWSISREFSCIGSPAWLTFFFRTVSKVLMRLVLLFRSLGNCRDMTRWFVDAAAFISFDNLYLYIYSNSVLSEKNQNSGVDIDFSPPALVSGGIFTHKTHESF